MIAPTAFCAAGAGEWQIETIRSILGPTLPAAGFLKITDGDAGKNEQSNLWTLRGTAGHARYVTRSETNQLLERQEALGRKGATCAALIPIRKSETWWTLAQDERRSIMEEKSRHFGIGMDYLPAVARKLYHSRDLGEPFDFLTWFEFSPDSASAFEELLGRLRATEEWQYVEREVEIRLTRTMIPQSTADR
ncbi:chlorite dismutase family protein [Rhizobium sp. SL86]|uniref:chlorite dismutase family protein n=1 Tax=Rhizobium sp. SL86 TaxID=2995148 RepID=UPI00227609F6|nr:chlorite dismutase family protein [Rhizobium sp. SL86]MCY1666682.1 chlorite dismutase family protein [Rhizobium sp. SL86]